MSLANLLYITIDITNESSETCLKNRIYGIEYLLWIVCRHNTMFTVLVCSLVDVNLK